ncbi:MAG: hypothetical protein WCI72_03995 [archaeon]
MSRVTFEFNKNEDLYNLWETVSKKPLHGYDFSKNMPSNLVTAIRGLSFKKTKPIISKYYANLYASGLIEISLKASETAWKTVEKEYFRRMDALIGKKLSAKKLIARITIAPRCPYNPQQNSFMIPFHATIPQVLGTCGHELMHLYFHEHYFDKIEKEIGTEKAQAIKEAVTVLLNTNFVLLLFLKDKGYESHRELRAFILDEWKKDNNFDKVVEKCVEKLKSEKVK